MLRRLDTDLANSTDTYQFKLVINIRHVFVVILKLSNCLEIMLNLFYYWKTDCWAILLECGMAGGGGPILLRLLK